MRLIFLGPPGSGKGTQAERIAKIFNLQFISIGDILREEIKLETLLGKRVKPYIENGALVPDKLILEIMRKRISNNQGFVLDGFPRTIKQAMGLDEITKVDKVVYFKCNSDTIVKRLSNRRICPQCAKVYNLITNPPTDDEICDNCKTKLKQREDDKEHTIRKRIKIYKSETLPLLNFYKKKSILEEVDASSGVDEVYLRLKEVLSG
ncbi:MAG: adenylate kinase [bacterium]|nr:adenylate kinase [bacterium]